MDKYNSIDIKDFIHLYLGCEAEFIYETRSENPELKYSKRIGKLVSIFNNGIVPCVEIICNSTSYNKRQDDVMPILRPLSDITEEEKKELYLFVIGRKFIGDNITHRDIGKKEERWVLWSGLERLFIYKDGDVGADSDLQYFRVHTPNIVKWQLSKHFDLFGLIEAGLAIDKTKLNSDNNEVKSKNNEQ